jgi:hypothetical protein
MGPLRYMNSGRKVVCDYSARAALLVNGLSAILTSLNIQHKCPSSDTTYIITNRFEIDFFGDVIVIWEVVEDDRVGVVTFALGVPDANDVQCVNPIHINYDKLDLADPNYDPQRTLNKIMSYIIN